MGAWGSGSFENDSALDWVAELGATSNAALLIETLTAVAHAERYVEVDEALLGRPLRNPLSIEPERDQGAVRVL